MKLLLDTVVGFTSNLFSRRRHGRAVMGREVATAESVRSESTRVTLIVCCPVVTKRCVSRGVGSAGTTIPSIVQM